MTDRPKWKDIVENHNRYYRSTAQRVTNHMTLAYVTPVRRDSALLFVGIVLLCTGVVVLILAFDGKENRLLFIVSDL